MEWCRLEVECCELKHPLRLLAICCLLTVPTFCLALSCAINACCLQTCHLPVVMASNVRIVGCSNLHSCCLPDCCWYLESVCLVSFCCISFITSTTVCWSALPSNSQLFLTYLLTVSCQGLHCVNCLLELSAVVACIIFPAVSRKLSWSLESPPRHLLCVRFNTSYVW